MNTTDLSHELQNNENKAPTNMGRLFVNLGSICAAFSFFSLWIGAFYLKIPMDSVIGFGWNDGSADGKCPSTLQGIGLHCFSDYYTPVQALHMTNPWESGYAYTPLAGKLFLPFDLLGQVLNSPRIGLIAYLVSGSLCVLIPTIWASRSSAGFSFPILVIFGIFATPLINAFDRGSFVMFITPLLFAYALNVCRQNWNFAIIALTLLSAIKPQFIVLLLPFLVHRQWFYLQRGLRWSIGLNVLGFIAFTSEPIVVFKQWLNFAIAYNDPSQAYGSSRANISPIRLLSEILSLPLKVINQIAGSQLSINSMQTTILVTLTLVLPLIIIGKKSNLFGLTIISMVIASIFIPTSNYYYQVFAVVPAAMIIRSPHTDTSKTGGILDDHMFQSNISWLAKWAILIATLNSCFNLAISDNLLPFMADISKMPGNVSRFFVGPTWVITIVFIVVDSVLTSRKNRTQ